MWKKGDLIDDDNNNLNISDIFNQKNDSLRNLCLKSILMSLSLYILNQKVMIKIILKLR